MYYHDHIINRSWHYTTLKSRENRPKIELWLIVEDQHGRQEDSRSAHAWHGIIVSDRDRDTVLISVCFVQTQNLLIFYN